jgi:hypothetical protein
MYDCLTYDGGVKGNTVILLCELDAAQGVIDEIKASLSKEDKEGIKSVHSIEFKDDEIVLRYFSNLDTGINTIPSANFLEAIDRIEKAIQDAEIEPNADELSDGGRIYIDANIQDLPSAPQLPALDEGQKDPIFVPFESNTSDEPEAPTNTTLAG